MVFANHRALKDHEARMRELLTGGDRRSANWGEAHIQTQLAFANWLGSVRWLLDHTKTRLHDEPEILRLFEDETIRLVDVLPTILTVMDIPFNAGDMDGEAVPLPLA